MAICSGNNKSYGKPVDNDTTINIGDLVRIKGYEWFDSLPLRYPGTVNDSRELLYNKRYLFNSVMKPLLGKVLRVCNKYHNGEIFTYKMEYVGTPLNVTLRDLTFTNEMIDEIVEDADL